MGDLVSLKTEIEHEGDLLIFEGFESAILGYGSRHGMPGPVVVYDRDTCIEIIRGDSGCTLEEAEDFFIEVFLDHDRGAASPFFVNIAPVQEH